MKAWIVFVGATPDEAVAYEAALREDNSMYDGMITHDFVFAYWPGIKSFSLLNGCASVLRVLYPNDTFLFAYPKAWLRDFQKYVQGRFGDHPATRTVGGYADIARGVGFATRAPLLGGGEAPAVGVQTVKHELAHLQNCGTWHDEKQGLLTHPLCGDCLIIRKIAGHEKLPWCQGEEVV